MLYLYLFTLCTFLSESDLTRIFYFFGVSVNLCTMDTNNWRPNQGTEPSMDTGDWRAQLQPESRQRIVNKMLASVLLLCYCVTDS